MRVVCSLSHLAKALAAVFVLGLLFGVLL